MTKRNKQKVLKALTNVRNLIVSGWVQGMWAATKDGQRCDELEACASNFCLSGAINRASLVTGVPTSLIRQAFFSVMKTTLINWNDAARRTKRQVIGLCDRVITHYQKDSKLAPVQRKRSSVSARY